MAIKIEDILASVETNDRRTVERAFRALVAFPTEVEPVDPAALRRALEAVCRALRNSSRVVPDRTVDGINDVLSPSGGTLLPNVSYGLLASTVMENMDRWSRLYERLATGNAPIRKSA